MTSQAAGLDARVADRLAALRVKGILAAFAVGWVAFVALKAETFGDAACAVLILAAGLLPAIIWTGQWRDTLPIMPMFGLIHVLHFGLPFTSQSSDVLNYSDEEKLAGALTVGYFLLVTTGAWATIMHLVRLPRPMETSFDRVRVRALLPYGFALAAIFNWAEMTGYSYRFESFLPVLRALFGSIFFLSAYLFGALWASGQLSVRLKASCIVLFALAAVTTWSSLYLYPSLFVIAICFIGYAISARRVHIALLATVLAVFFVLQAGKAEMRDEYQESQSVSSILELPGFVAQWVGKGLVAIASPREEQAVSFSERIGLMHMLLRVQQMTPSQVDYVGGETYALIPRLLVPRFLDPDKPTAHAGLIMLNIRYGILTLDESERTSVGWGLLSEAFANFGESGIVGLALVLGALFGVVTLWVSGAPAMSGRAMFGVIFLITTFNLEADTAIYVSTLFQGGVAIIALVLLFKTIKPSRPTLLE